MLYPAELRARETAILSYSAAGGMIGGPFAWEILVRREVLEDEIARLRELPYSLWRDVVGREVFKNARGRDERNYRLRVTAVWARAECEDIRIIVILETPALHRPLMRQSFVITPDDQLRE
jgi:hypothetical protein